MLNRYCLCLLLVVGIAILLLIPSDPTEAQTTCSNPYVVQSGDTLAEIALQCGTTVSALLIANPDIIDPAFIYTGQLITLPGTDEAQPTVRITPNSGDAGTIVQVNAEGFRANIPVSVGVGQLSQGYLIVGNTTTNQAGAFSFSVTIPTYANANESWVVVAETSDGLTRRVSNTFTVSPVNIEVCPNPYTVQYQDTLAQIAAICNTTVPALLAVNPQITNPAVIYTGWLLNIPTGNTTLQPSASVTPTSGVVGTQVTLNATGFPATTNIQIGIGQQGTEFVTIAASHTNVAGELVTQVTVPTTATPNENWLFRVSTLDNLYNATTNPFTVLPTTTNPPTNPPDSQTCNGTYTVAYRDTLFEIAVLCNVSLADLINANPQIVNPALIYVGQVLNIPTGDGSSPNQNLFTRTNIYLIAVGDDGRSGLEVGCNDSVLPIEVGIEPTVAPLTAAIETLLANHNSLYGQTNLFNALYQSNLSLQSITIVNREAVIRLSGTVRSGGVCDDPRIKAQLEQTALQYGTVDRVSIYVNGVLLDQIL